MWPQVGAGGMQGLELCARERMQATVSWFHVDTGLCFLENLFFWEVFVLVS